MRESIGAYPRASSGQLTPHADAPQRWPEGRLIMSPTQELIVAFVNAGAVVVLTVITAWYAVSTARMLREMRAQGDASRKQAEVAERTLEHLLREAEERHDTALSVVQAIIDQCRSTISDWQGYNLADLTARGVLPEPSLVPDGSGIVSAHVQMVAPAAVAPFSRTVSRLRSCESELHALGRDRPSTEIARQIQRIQSLLREASEQLDLAANELPGKAKAGRHGVPATGV